MHVRAIHHRSPRHSAQTTGRLSLDTDIDGFNQGATLEERGEVSFDPVEAAVDEVLLRLRQDVVRRTFVRATVGLSPVVEVARVHDLVHKAARCQGVSLVFQVDPWMRVRQSRRVGVAVLASIIDEAASQHQVHGLGCACCLVFKGSHVALGLRFRPARRFVRGAQPRTGVLGLRGGLFVAVVTICALRAAHAGTIQSLELAATVHSERGRARHCALTDGGGAVGGSKTTAV
mmetsp:Transcript_17349/g.25461  ORF Transcript_17349/g.25461 Transcript_17349/m.25461 type:complete len:232 (+) Transcript_17349:4968-5663(+)